MWVFDGEEWIEEGSSPKSEKNNPSSNRRELEEFYPELQIVEVPLTPEPIPPFPSL
jgi:hypothetical protein